MTQLAFPFGFDGRGRTAASDEDRHVRDLIEQVLFTQPGERVNLPQFGSGLMQLVFAAGGDTLAAATRQIVQASLQQWLGDLVLLEDVDTEFNEGTLTVTVKYVNRRTQSSRLESFSLGGL
jgi:phage baseplate assembly protein W